MKDSDLIRRSDAFAFQNDVEPLICKSPITGDVFSATKDTDIVEYLSHIPAVDAVEVVHAYWINGHESRYQNVHDKYTCSNCGEPASTAFGAAVKSRFCQWCGARMDGRREDGDA